MEPVDNLNDKIKGLQKQVEKIQDGCKHKDREIKWNNECRCYKWMCISCKLWLGYPTIFEMEKFCK